MRSVEDGYWWYNVLRGLVLHEVGRSVSDMQHLRILDAGCGTGGTLASLSSAFGGAELAGFDLSLLAVKHTHARGFADVFEASVDAIPLCDCSQDVILSLDVLYHERVDQVKAMHEFRRVLVPGGRLLMNLPAFECLRGQHDVAVKNARRYTPREVRELHERHGFAVERVFCWNAWLFLPVLMWRKFSNATASGRAEDAESDLVSPVAWVNKLLATLGGWEAAVCRTVQSPIGTSVFSVGVKK